MGREQPNGLRAKDDYLSTYEHGPNLEQVSKRATARSARYRSHHSAARGHLTKAGSYIAPIAGDHLIGCATASVWAASHAGGAAIGVVIAAGHHTGCSNDVAPGRPAQEDVVTGVIAGNRRSHICLCCRPNNHGQADDRGGNRSAA